MLGLPVGMSDMQCFNIGECYWDDIYINNIYIYIYIYIFNIYKKFQKICKIPLYIQIMSYLSLWFTCCVFQVFPEDTII